MAPLPALVSTHSSSRLLPVPNFYSGNFGKWYTERGLTFSTVELSGHMVPQYAPTAAYRQLEFLLGRIEDLGQISDFTTMTGDFGNNATITMF